MEQVRRPRIRPVRFRGTFLTIARKKLGIEIKDLIVDLFVRSGSAWPAIISTAVLPFLIWSFVGDAQLGIALIGRVGTIQPWIQGLQADELYPWWFPPSDAHAADTTAKSTVRAGVPKDSIVHIQPPMSPQAQPRSLVLLCFGVFLILQPFILSSMIVLLIFRMFNPKHLRLARAIQRNYMRHIEQQEGNLRAVSRLLRRIHYERGGDVITGKQDDIGLRDFLRKFTHANKAQVRDGRARDPLGYSARVGSRTLLSMVVQRFEAEAPTIMLGVIDGDMRIRASARRMETAKDYMDYFMLLYFAKLDCNRSPQNQITRVFSYHGTTEGIPEDQVCFFILNVVCGVSTIVHVELCDECKPARVCEECQADVSGPMFGLDYVVVPRSRAHLDSPRSTGRARRGQNPTAATVFVDFDSEAYVLQDGVLVDVFKQDFEKRLLTKRVDGGPVRANVTRLSPENLKHPNLEVSLQQHVTPKVVAAAVGELITFFQSASRLSKDNPLTEKILAEWKRVLEASASAAPTQNGPEDLKRLAIEMLGRLVAFKEFIEEPIDRA